MARNQWHIWFKMGVQNQPKYTDSRPIILWDYNHTPKCLNSVITGVFDR